MKVQELLEKINSDHFDFENELDIKKYLQIDVKKTIAQGIIYECTEMVDGIYKMDSVQRYLSYVRYMITMHTNLEYSDEDYDILCSTEYLGARLIDRIMNYFEDDAKECKKVLEFMMDDYMREIGLEHNIANFLNGLNATISNFVNKLNIESLQSMIPNNIDMSKLSTFLNNYIK